MSERRAESMSQYNEKTLSRAMQPTIDALERKIAESPRWLRPVLTEIRDHFYEPRYSVSQLRRNLGANNWFFTRVRRHIGLTPWRLIRELRMELGMRLLRDTSIYVKDVAFCVGYEEFGNFNNLCLAWCRLSPAELRAQLRRMKNRLRSLPEDVLTWDYWLRAVSGQLTPREARRLISYLESSLRR